MSRRAATPSIILIRHAHRDTADRAFDNGLSDKGRAEAEALQKFFVKKCGSSWPPAKMNELALISSPKRRCIETLTPIQELTGVNISVNQALDEQKASETTSQFIQRCRAFLNAVSSPLGSSEDSKLRGKRWIVLCSHGDWLPLAVQVLTHSPTLQPLAFKKGSWTQIEEGQLVALLQPSDLD
jgi:broad specificity phosphatase PhoE